MKRLMTLNGHAANADDPQRAIFFSQQCGYWTDDWSKLRRVGPGIPCCPHCHSVGYQATYAQWQSNTAKQEESNPGYAAKVASMKERCARVMTHFLPVASDNN